MGKWEEGRVYGGSVGPLGSWMMYLMLCYGLNKKQWVLAQQVPCLRSWSMVEVVVVLVRQIHARRVNVRDVSPKDPRLGLYCP